MGKKSDDCVLGKPFTDKKKIQVDCNDIRYRLLVRFSHYILVFVLSMI